MQRVVFVHGSVGNGDAAWVEQRPLADQFELVILNRPGFPPGPLVDRVDFEEHAEWVVERMQPGDHLCGHSYGAVVSLYAAAKAPDLRSLTVVEPPAFGIAAGRAGADEFLARIKPLWSDGPREPRAFLAAFYAAVAGRDVELPDPLPPEMYQGAQILMIERGPWEARPPLDQLRAAAFPKLVVSGGWSPGFDAVCDVLEERLHARRTVLPGMGHNPQLLGKPFNDVLREFLEVQNRRLRPTRVSLTDADPRSDRAPARAPARVRSVETVDVVPWRAKGLREYGQFLVISSH